MTRHALIEMPRGWLTSSLLVLALSIAAAAYADTGAPSDRYRVLDWQDLVPDGWEPPPVAPAYDVEAAKTVDSNAVVEDLDEQLAAIPGYMKPVVYDGNQVSEFLLVPYLPHQVTAHVHLDANQMVYVYAHEPVVVANLYQPIWVVGAVSIEPVMTDEGPAAYRIVDAVTTTYEF